MTATRSASAPTANNSSSTPRCQDCPSRHGSVFCDLEAASIATVDLLKIYRTFKSGDMLFDEGATAAGLVCIYEGNIKLVKTGREGKEQIVGFLRPGEIAGYRALLGSGKHTARAITLGPVRVCYIPKAAFFSAMATDATLQSKIVRQLSDELRLTEERYVATAQHSVRQRLAETLVELKQIFGFEEDGQTLDIQLRRSDIASIVGTAPESVIRMLSDFKKAGIIDMDGRKIRILRLRTLLREAGLAD